MGENLEKKKCNFVKLHCLPQQRWCCFTFSLSQSVSTFKIRNFKVWNWSEPHSMDSPGHQCCAKFFVRCWWPRKSMLRGSLHFCTLKLRILKVLTLCQSVKIKQHYLSHLFIHFRILQFQKCDSMHSSTKIMLLKITLSKLYEDKPYFM